MTDVIWGRVTNVVDGDTFDITIVSTSPLNKYVYGLTERIRIANSNAPEINTLKGVIAKLALHSMLFNKFVRLWVYVRDSFGRLVCNIQIEDEQKYGT